jgi:hypothetical protein
MKTRIIAFLDVLKHKRAFMQVRSRNPTLKRYISLKRALAHDLGKAFLILLIGDKWATKIHRANAGHHLFLNTNDMYEAICDWECAHITKPDKPLKARATWEAYFKALPMDGLLKNCGY